MKLTFVAYDRKSEAIYKSSSQMLFCSKLTSIFTSFYWHCELCKQNTVIKKRGQNFFMRTKRGGTISKYRLLLVPHPPLPHYASDPSFPASFRVESHPFAFWEGRKYRGHFALITELVIWLLATFCRTIDPGNI